MSLIYLHSLAAPSPSRHPPLPCHLNPVARSLSSDPAAATPTPSQLSSRPIPIPSPSPPLSSQSRRLLPLFGSRRRDPHPSQLCRPTLCSPDLARPSPFSPLPSIPIPTRHRGGRSSSVLACAASGTPRGPELGARQSAPPVALRGGWSSASTCLHVPPVRAFASTRLHAPPALSSAFARRGRPLLVPRGAGAPPPLAEGGRR
jgi:hypothetical protein